MRVGKVLRVPVRIACGMSTATDPREAAAEAAREAAGGLEGAEHRSRHRLRLRHAPARTGGDARGGLGRPAPGELIGCGASGIVGEGREIEDGTAVSVWAADLGDGTRDGVPRRDAGARGRDRRARHARARGRRRRDPAPRPRLLPARRPARRAHGPRARRADPRRRRERGRRGGRTTLFLGERGPRERCGRRAARRRRGAAARVAGRAADRARADDHRRRRADHPGARRAQRAD